MAVQGIQPFIHISDSNGNPYVGAKLYVYTAGTTTLKAIYSDDGLSAALTNPLTSDSAGKFARFYMAAGTYKLYATTSAGVALWTYDNLDTGLSAGTGALPITGGGTGATTAAAARANLDVPSNSELTALSSTISDLQTSILNIVSVPQGRLTPTTNTPVISSEVTAGAALYYTPYIGNLCPIYDGAQLNATVFGELTLTLSSNHSAGSIYDCFLINDSGTVRLVTGPSWNTATAGAGARGSGAGTTELTRTNGLLTNANSMTARNGATTYTVSANRGTYVGSIVIDGTNGQVSCHLTYGQSRKFAIWNAYNRVPIILVAGDGTASWTYGTSNYRPSNNATANSITVFCGLAEESVFITAQQKVSPATGASSTTQRIGIGWNSTTSPLGTLGEVINSVNSTSLTDIIVARYNNVPFIGINTITMLEYALLGSSATFYGTQSYMALTANHRG